ncbi:MAG: adenylate/guanylate cyclase domain-containing protein [Gammaproteobacteria bacterium]|nr:adenylate/guanylate cyclase domain-containing protein [Gammaproteobacteria bacterium]
MALLEATLESILVTAADLESPGPTIVYVNPAFERMTGWSKEEIVGQSPRVLQGPSTDLSVFDDLKPKLLRGETWQGRAINYRKDGQEFIMEWSIAPIRDDRNVIYQYVAVQRDVTERVETEHKLERAREAVVDGLRKREFLHEMFGKFIPNTIVDQVVANAGMLEPDLREATVFFSDIAGFTMLTERMDPRSIISLLNEYFSLVTVPIESRGGVIHQFQGDAILATFNLPVQDPHHAANAVAAALEIQDTLGTYRFGNGSTLSTRIGINTGTVVAGTVGSSGRLGYTVHGDAVNLAARIEQENKRFGTQILITEATEKEIGDEFDCRAVETISVRGRRQPVTIYAVK